MKSEGLGKNNVLSQQSNKSEEDDEEEFELSRTLSELDLFDEDLNNNDPACSGTRSANCRMPRMDKELSHIREIEVNYQHPQQDNIDTKLETKASGISGIPTLLNSSNILSTNMLESSSSQLNSAAAGSVNQTPSPGKLKKYRLNEYNSPSDLIQLVKDISGNRQSNEFFVSAIRKKHHPNRFYINVVEMETRKTLGYICLDREQFLKARAEGIFTQLSALFLMKPSESFLTLMQMR